MVRYRGEGENLIDTSPDPSRFDRMLFGLGITLSQGLGGLYVTQNGLRTERIARMFIRSEDKGYLIAYRIREKDDTIIHEGLGKGLPYLQTFKIARYLLCATFPRFLEGMTGDLTEKAEYMRVRKGGVKNLEKSIDAALAYQEELTRNRPQYNPQE